MLTAVPPPRGSTAGERCYEFAHDVIAKAALEWGKQFRQAQEAAETARTGLMRELELTREVSMSLLPQLPKSDYFDLHAVSPPCHMVGGDYYDVLSLSDDRLGFAVADVSGRGFPAAFTAAQLQGIFAAVALGDPNLEDLFWRVNMLWSERKQNLHMFATLFYGVLSRSGDLSWGESRSPRRAPYAGRRLR